MAVFNEGARNIVAGTRRMCRTVLWVHSIETPHVGWME